MAEHNRTDNKGGINEPWLDSLEAATDLSPFELVVAAARRARHLTNSAVHTNGGVAYTKSTVPDLGSRPPLSHALHELAAGHLRVDMPDGDAADSGNDTPST